MADRDMPELTLLYGKLGAVGIVGGLLMTTPLLEMYWQGIVAISIARLLHFFGASDVGRRVGRSSTRPILRLGRRRFVR
jgi:membrane protein implicated in regulation of membrane protease activity